MKNNFLGFIYSMIPKLIPKLIPKVIHQIWIQGFNMIPNKFKKYKQDCQKINNDFEFILWDDHKIKKFLEENYSEDFLELYNFYKIPAQKADFARYAILFKYGGIYLDMDMLCKKNLVPFLNYNVFFTRHAFSINKTYLNGILGAQPKHPLFTIILRLIFERKNSFKDVRFSTGTKLLYDSVQEYLTKYQNDITIIDPKHLHPCDIYTNERRCSQYCRDCYVVHMNNGSWSSGLKIINFLKENLFFILFLLIMVLLYIYLKNGIIIL